MKKFEINFLTLNDPEFSSYKLIIEADLIEMSGDHASVSIYDDNCELREIAWFKNVVYWRELEDDK
jgi:hypothetical protein